MRTTPLAARTATAALALAAAIALGTTVPAAAAPRTTVLSVGVHSAAVADLQRQLNDQLGEIAPLETDGKFGPLTRDAVTWYQTCAGIDVDGVAGPQTRAALAANAGRKVDTVCVRNA
ncbi:peptidoglycan-binding domain-containing protein [Kitasatospora aburaviensis]|uniref:Peptidoglycan-binding domain-containing protein n=1 Tax=Kitasatospora aburaviensis TaxID=67265 RepID=A0ABW1FA11_9ACTN